MAVGYLISYSKQTAALGEVVQIQTNLPEGATAEDIGNELTKLGSSLDTRMRSLNNDVLKRTGKTLEDLGIDVPGFTKSKDDE